MFASDNLDDRLVEEQVCAAAPKPLQQGLLHVQGAIGNRKDLAGGFVLGFDTFIMEQLNQFTRSECGEAGVQEPARATESVDDAASVRVMSEVTTVNDNNKDNDVGLNKSTTRNINNNNDIGKTENISRKDDISDNQVGSSISIYL